MPSLQVRELPREVYERLAAEAEREHRSISQQALVLLERALKTSPENKVRRNALIDRLLAEPIVLPGLTDPVKMIREDRAR